MFYIEKKPFLAIKNLIFESPRKLNFSKGVNPCFWSKKKSNFLLYLFSVKIRLEIMVNNVAIQNSSF